MNFRIDIKEPKNQDKPTASSFSSSSMVSIKGKTFSVSGHIPGFNRETFITECIRVGAKGYDSPMTSRTSLLIQGIPSRYPNNSIKVDKAKRLGLPIIKYDMILEYSEMIK